MKYKFKFLNPEISLEERLDDLISRLTIDEKIGLLSTHQNAIPRLGIKEWYIGTEVARGYISHEKNQPSTVLPQPIGMSSMFDPELMYKLGEIAATEARIYNQNGYENTKLMMWGPTVDLCRDPRWGRNEEGYGEDPFLTGQNTIAYTQGMRGEDEFYMRSVPTLKHFCANNNEKDRGSCSANIEPRTKHEYYYASFRPSVEEGGAYSMMAAYNELSGVPAVLNPDIQQVVKDKWGLGFVVTDGGDYSQNVTDHEYCRSHAESLALTIRAGSDVMTDDQSLVTKAAKDGLYDGILIEEDINRSIKNSLRGRFRLGEFDPDEANPYANIDKNLLNCDEYKALNQRAAMEGVTLLKNDGILPLNKDKIKKIAVLGPIGNRNFRDWYTGTSTYEFTALAGIKEHFENAEVTFDDGYDHVKLLSKSADKYVAVDKDGRLLANSNGKGDDAVFFKYDWGFNETNFVSKSNGMFVQDKGEMVADSDTTFRWFVNEIIRPEEIDGYKTYKTLRHKDIAVTENGVLSHVDQHGITDEKLFTEELFSAGIERAVALAKKSDVAVVCVGNDPLIVARECYDRPDINLPPHQAELIRRVREANKNTIVVIISSYPYAINEEQKTVPAIVYTSHAGPELGRAIAKTLSGENNPAGRTPQTWYTSIRELPDLMDYDIIGSQSTYMYYKGKPLYPFGYGLSYSKFEYTSLKINSEKDCIKLTVKVKNISDVDGEEVVQVYFKANNPRVKRPNKQLCAFKREHFRAGEQKTLEFVIENRRLEFWDVTRDKFCVEFGEYTFMVGASSGDIR